MLNKMLLGAASASIEIVDWDIRRTGASLSGFAAGDIGVTFTVLYDINDADYAGGLPVIQNETGWTVARNITTTTSNGDVRHYMAYKVLDGTEGAADWPNVSGQSTTARIVLRNAAASSPFQYANAGSGTSISVTAASGLGEMTLMAVSAKLTGGLSGISPPGFTLIGQDEVTLSDAQTGVLIYSSPIGLWYSQNTTVSSGTITGASSNRGLIVADFDFSEP